MQPHILPPLNRLSEQEEDDDDEDDGDYGDIEEGDDMDNVSKCAETTASEFKCHTGPGDSKFNVYSCATDTLTPHANHSLRKRSNAAIAKVKTNKSKCVKFIQLPKLNDDSPPAELNEHHSKPLKKIIFNGTFPIDDPYSSRF